MRVKKGLQNAQDFFMKCIQTNEDLLKFGGSSELQSCLTVSQLNSLFQDDENMKSLVWSDDQKRMLAKYSNGLIQSCKALGDMSKNFLNYVTLKQSVRYIFITSTELKTL